MIDKIGHIKNPLTVIAIFASVSEISGVLVLPHIAENNQRLFIWFLMMFPTFLVTIFFVTLNFNHKKLYAPSDYKNEDNFILPYGRATEEELGEKKSDESAELSFVEKKNDIKKFSMKDYMHYEKSAIEYLSEKLNLSFEENVTFPSKSTNRPLIFDAAYVSKNVIEVVEVKLFRSHKFSPSMIRNALMEATLFSNSLINSNKKFKFHILAVLLTKNPSHINHIKRHMDRIASQYNLNVTIHIVSEKDLGLE